MSRGQDRVIACRATLSGQARHCLPWHMANENAAPSLLRAGQCHRHYDHRDEIAGWPLPCLRQPLNSVRVGHPKPPTQSLRRPSPMKSWCNGGLPNRNVEEAKRCAPREMTRHLDALDKTPRRNAPSDGCHAGQAIGRPGSGMLIAICRPSAPVRLAQVARGLFRCLVRI